MNKSRADYDALAQIAAKFGLAAQQAATATQTVRAAMNPLQNGDWVGAGAEAFYAEMNSAVLPSLARWVAAMQSAQTTTLAIRAEFMAAEAEAKIILTPNENVAQQTLTPISGLGLSNLAIESSGALSSVMSMVSGPLGILGGLLKGVAMNFNPALLRSRIKTQLIDLGGEPMNGSEITHGFARSDRTFVIFA